jgi:hypothetical protein
MIGEDIWMYIFDKIYSKVSSKYLGLQIFSLYKEFLGVG